MNTKEVIDKIFKDPKTKYELTEFDIFGKSIDDIIEIYPKVIESGREAGKTKYFKDTLYDFPKRGQESKDVLAARKTLGHLQVGIGYVEGVRLAI